MPISFSCQNCGQVIKVSRKYAGKKGRCPKCTEPTHVPQIAAPLHDVISDDLPPFGSEESREPLPAGTAPAEAAPPPPRKGRGRREKKKPRPSPKPRKSGPNLVVLVPALMVLVVGGVGVALYSKLQEPKVVGGGGGEGGTETLEDTSRQDMQTLLTSLDRLEALGTGGTVEEVNELRRLLEGLRESPLAKSASGQLLEAGDRLLVQEDLARAAASLDTGDPPSAGTDDPTGDGAERPWSGPGDRAEKQLDLLSAGCARILRLSLRERGSTLRRGAEPFVARDLRGELTRKLGQAQAEGPIAVFELVTDVAWQGLLGPGGYAQILELAASYRRDLGADPRCKRLINRARQAAEVAMAYEAALNAAELACGRGDLKQALNALATGPHKDDPWFAATRDYLESPEVGALVEGLVDRPTTPEGGAGGDPATGGLELALGWRERLADLVDQDEGTARTAGLNAVLAEALEEARLGWAAAERVVADLDDSRKALLDVETLADAVERIERVYFESGFADASGPATFGALANWSKKHDRDAWHRQLEPFLRLIPQRDKRDKARRKRAQAYAVVARFTESRLERLTADLRGLVGWMRAEGYAPEDAKASVTALVERVLEPCGATVAAAGMRAQLDALEHTAAEDDASQLEKAFSRGLAEAARRSRKATGEAVEACLSAGESGLAFDLFAYALLLDPDDKQARKALGQVQTGDAWLRPYEAKRYKSGFAWDPERAWVRRDLRSKYKPDRHFDLQRETWDTLTALNERHAAPDDPWVVETEHFEVRSNAPLHRTAEVCEVLEEFFLALFRLYEPFFVGRGAKGVFGSAAVLQGRLRVRVYKDKQQYRDYSECPASSDGQYSPGRDSSFFYDNGKDDWTTLRHETTHHILAEASGKRRGDRHAWISEGAAVFVQNATRRPDGVLTAGGIQDNAHVRVFASGLPKDTELTVSETFALQSSAEWDAASLKGYRAAGGLIHFLCHMDGGRYQADVVDMVRDAYNGKPVTLETYTGLTPEAIEVFLRHFYEQRRTPR